MQRLVRIHQLFDHLMQARRLTDRRSPRFVQAHAHLRRERHGIEFGAAGARRLFVRFNQLQAGRRLLQHPRLMKGRLHRLLSAPIPNPLLLLMQQPGVAQIQVVVVPGFGGLVEQVGAADQQADQGVEQHRQFVFRDAANIQVGDAGEMQRAQPHRLRRHFGAAQHHRADQQQSRPRPAPPGSATAARPAVGPPPALPAHGSGHGSPCSRVRP